MLVAETVADKKSRALYFTSLKYVEHYNNFFID
jgi:hypothetical protein